MSEKMLDIKEGMYKFLQEPTREKFIDIVFNGVGEQKRPFQVLCKLKKLI